MVKKFLTTFLVSGLTVGVLSTSVFATTGKVTGNNVRIREKANSKSIEVSVASKGEKVEILGEEGNWYHIKFEKVTGYISKDFVDTDYKSEKLNEVTEPVKEEPKVENNEPEKNEVKEELVVEEKTEVQEPEKNQESTPVEEQPQVVESNNELPVESNVVSQSNNYDVNQVIILESDLGLKNLPSFMSKEKNIAQKEKSYTIKAVLNNWVKLENENCSGWALKSSIVKKEEVKTTENTVSQQVENTTPVNKENPAQTVENKSSKGKVNVDNARIRKSPDGDPIDTLSNGTEVTILGEEGDWYKVKVKEYDSCYIAKRLITIL